MSSRTKSLFAAYFIIFLDNLGFALIFTLFPTLLLNPDFAILPLDLGEKTRNIYLGLVLISSAFAQFFGAPFFGDIADRFGRKKGLYWTLAGTIFGYVLTALGVLFKLYYLILFSRLITGFFAGNLTICMAIISDMNSGKRQRGRALSYVASCLGVSWTIAILIGGIFTDPRKLQLLIDPSLPFWVIGALTVLSLFVLYKMYRETVFIEGKHRIQILKGIHQIIHVIEHKQLRVLYLTLFFWFFGFYISLQWVTPFSIDEFRASTTQIIWLLTLVGFVWSCSSGFLNPWLIGHSSLWKISLWSLFLVSLFYFFSAVTDFFFYFAASYTLSAIFAAMGWGNNMSLISFAASNEDLGKSLGIGQSMLSLAQFLGPLMGGLVAGYAIEAIFYSCALLVFISFLFLLIYVVQRKSRLLTHS